MKLSEAMDWLLTEHKFVMSDHGVKEDDREWRGPYREITAVSGGVSYNERFMGHLESSIFGMRYHVSSSRGGLDVYHIPVKDIEEDKDSDWFGLMEPNPNPLEGFHNMGGNFEVVAVPSVRYVYVEKDDIGEQIRHELASALDALIGKFGVENLVNILNEEDEIEGWRFLDDRNMLKLTVGFEDHSKATLISTEELDELLG